MVRAARDQCGQVVGSVLAVVSLVVIVGAAVGLVFTGTPDSRGQAPVAQRSAAGQPDQAPTSAKGDRADRPGKQAGKHKKQQAKQKKQQGKKQQKPQRKPAKRPPPVPDVYVEVYNNNTGITGLAAATAAELEAAGWEVVGIANWYGDMGQSGVYAPPHLQAQARRLARTLGIGHTGPAVPPMDGDKLTVILTSDYPG